MAKHKKTILSETLTDQEFNLALIRESIKKNRGKTAYVYGGEAMRRSSAKQMRMTAKQQAKEEREKLGVNGFLASIIGTEYIRDRNELIDFLEVLKAEQRKLYWIKVIVDKVRSPTARYFIENGMELFGYSVDNECIGDKEPPIVRSRELNKDPDFYTGMMGVWGATRFPLREYEYRMKRVLDYDELLSYARTGDDGKESGVVKFL